MKIYLAGPDVFLPDALAIGQRKQDICRLHGVTGLYPLDNTVDLAVRGSSLQIFKGNEAMMDAADAIIANMTPFRGPGADSGTVYELGYFAGRGTPCVQQRSHHLCGARCAVHAGEERFRQASGRCRRTDRRGLWPAGQSDDDPCARPARLAAGAARCKACGHLARSRRVRGMRAPGSRTMG